MRIFTWNVNGWKPTLRNIELKYGSLASFFQSIGADIVCLQEIKLPEDALNREIKNVDGYESFWSCSRAKKGYSGVATFVKLEYAACAAATDEWLCGDRELHEEGRLVMTDHDAFVLINVYAPNAGDRPARARLSFKLSFFEALRTKVESLMNAGRQVVVTGDLNIPRSISDVHRQITWDGLYSSRELETINGLTMLLHDVWRERHPDVTNVFTVWSERTNARAGNVGLRIDYILCSADLAAKCTHCEVDLEQPVKWSDHAPVVADLDLQAPAVSGRAPCTRSSRHQSKGTLKALFGAVPSKKGAASATSPHKAPASSSDAVAGTRSLPTECTNLEDFSAKEFDSKGHKLPSASKRRRVETDSKDDRQDGIAKFFVKPGS